MIFLIGSIGCFKKWLEGCEKMRAQVKIDELRCIANKIFDSFESIGCFEFSLEEDFYWDVHENERYDFTKSPDGYSVGQLFDDIYFLRKILEDEEMACPIMFLHLFPILRYMALRVGFDK
ncbi:hypothetical protein ABFV80_001462 [Vandammella animalimorsus]|uniref:hypothetical protein n=1 Tax=Vandammella animalimorsus TaxID=2029117 RepID=UPI00325B2D52